jgi:hypothetical protein
MNAFMTAEYFSNYDGVFDNSSHTCEANSYRCCRIIEAKNILKSTAVHFQ